MNLASSIETLTFLIAQASEAVPAGAPAGGGGAAPPSPTSGLMSMMPLLVAFMFIMYFLTIRPQQKKEKERQAMLNSIAKGDEVVTTGGICGKVVGLTESDVVLRVDDDVKIKFLRSAIAHVVSADGESASK